MNNLQRKIVLTAIYVLILIGVAGLAIRFALALWEMDDDAMFIYGFTLAAITCTVVLVNILASDIALIWKKKKNKKSEDKKCK